MEKRGGNRTGGWRILEIMFNARPRDDLTRFETRGLIGKEVFLFFYLFYFWNQGVGKEVTGGKCAETEKSLKSRVVESGLNCGARMTSGGKVWQGRWKCQNVILQRSDLKSFLCLLKTENENSQVISFPRSASIYSWHVGTACVIFSLLCVAVEQPLLCIRLSDHSPLCRSRLWYLDVQFIRSHVTSITGSMVYFSNWTKRFYDVWYEENNHGEEALTSACSWIKYWLVLWHEILDSFHRS